MWTALDNVIVGGRYELREHLATGGMAVVFRGWDFRLRRPVAVKVLRDLDDADEVVIERFRREARAAASLQHPHIVEVYDFFEEDGCYYLVMELVDGPNLKERLIKSGPLDCESALRVAAQVCSALDAAHECGFIHRDIKPQNILLAPTGEAKLADFGIVHIPRETAFTTGGMVLGTADYISPEQAQGLELRPTTDIYSLGVVLYEMVAGALPFTGATPMSVAVQHATAPVPPLCRANPAIPKQVERLVQRALRKNPEQRFPSARAMGAALIGTADELRAGTTPASPTSDAATSPDADAVAPKDVPTWRVVAERLLWPATPEASDGLIEDESVGESNLAVETGAYGDASLLRAERFDALRLLVLLCAAGLLLAATLALNSVL
ncbi:MAG TPA: serine/threonine-protein kinase [Ktedonobacterales bacterium]|nr:serine/threonine-protein kinase [Ktedonobacterales bacterium]